MNGFIIIKRSIAGFAFVAALSSASIPTQAEVPVSTSPPEPSIKIKFSDLDLSKPDAAAALYRRIELSARLVCKDSSSPWDAGRLDTFKRCYAAAMDDAVSRVNQPQLTALHRTRTVLVGAAPK